MIKGNVIVRAPWDRQSSKKRIKSDPNVWQKSSFGSSSSYIILWHSYPLANANTTRRYTENLQKENSHSARLLCHGYIYSSQKRHHRLLHAPHRRLRCALPTLSSKYCWICGCDVSASSHCAREERADLRLSGSACVRFFCFASGGERGLVSGKGTATGWSKAETLLTLDLFLWPNYH